MRHCLTEGILLRKRRTQLSSCKLASANRSPSYVRSYISRRDSLLARGRPCVGLMVQRAKSGMVTGLS